MIDETYYEAGSIEALLGSIPSDLTERLELCGCVYAFEVGNAVKIGFTTDVVGRLSAWRSFYKNVAVKLGRAAVTIPHLDAMATERGLHSAFAPYAIRKEFFSIKFDALLKEISALSLRAPSDDEILKRIERKREHDARFAEASKQAVEQLFGHLKQPNVKLTEADLHRLIDHSEDMVALPWAAWVIKDFEEWWGLVRMDRAIELGKRCAALARAEPNRSRKSIFNAVTDEFHAEYLAA